MSKKTCTNQTRKYGEQIGGCQRWRVAKVGEGGQRIMTSSYRINKPWGCNL